MIEAHRFGPLIDPETRHFRLWAPGAKSVDAAVR